MNREVEILKFASEISKRYYGKPLVILDEACEEVARKCLDEYETSDEFVRERMNVSTKYERVFCMQGITKHGNRFFDYKHAKEVFKEAVDDDVWDCFIVTAVRYNTDIMVNPFGVDCD